MPMLESSSNTNVRGERVKNQELPVHDCHCVCSDAVKK